MKISDTVVGAGFAAAGVLTVAATLGYPSLDGGHPGPALFPRILGTLMAIFGGCLSLRGLRARDVSDQVAWLSLHRSQGFVNALFVLSGVIVYIVVADRLGFLVVGTAVMFVLMGRLEVRAGRALLIAAGFTVVVYVLFARVLLVPLPRGIIPW